MSKILIIGTVWPEPNSTATGKRMLQIIEQFQDNCFKIVFASAAQIGEFSFSLISINVEMIEIELNNSSFDDYVLALNPDVVLFDRFMIEEQFGWRIAENCPNCLRILDTEDLHFLRDIRFMNLKKNQISTSNDYLNSELAKREIASIYRCDISLIISEIEMNILTNVFKIDENILHYLPFLLDEITEVEMDNLPSFSERQHFISIGNFRHKPNYNTVLYLKETIWPLIKNQLSNAELHIYGSYCSAKVMQLHNLKDGFLVKGRAENAFEVIKNSRVLLAPIRFGAGIKGKLTDAMQCGTPSITTEIGAESMFGNLEWNGAILNDPTDFANAAITFYNNETLWKNAQKNGVKIINNRFNKKNHGTTFIKNILETKNNLTNHRTNNFIGAVLQIQTLKSTKYMSKWIEAKNAIRE